MKFRILSVIGLTFVFTILSVLCSCTQTLNLPTKKATDLPAESEQEKQIIDKAKKHFVNMEFDSANTLFNKVLELNPYNIRSVYYLSKIFLELKDYNESLKYCQLGLDYDSDYYQHFAATLGECYNGLDRTGSAISVLEQAVAMFPLNDKILYNLAFAYNHKRYWEDAELPLIRSIAINPYFEEAHLLLAEVYEHLFKSQFQYLVLLTYLAFNENNNQPNAIKKLNESLNNVMNFNEYTIVYKTKTYSLHLINLDYLKDSALVNMKLFQQMSRVRRSYDSLESNPPFHINELVALLGLINKNYKEQFNLYQNALFFRIYFKFLSDLYDSGYSETMSYYIYSSTGYSSIKNWIGNNKSKIDDFRKWINEYQW